MNNLIPIKYDENFCVSARDLWKFLGNKKGFSNWIKLRISQYSFELSRDYTFDQIVKRTGTGATSVNEYFITIDMAKELCMVENNEKGKQARKYFIEVENQYKKQRELLTQNNTVLMALTQTLQLINNELKGTKQITKDLEKKDNLLEMRLVRIEDKVNKKVPECVELQLVPVTVIGKMFTPAKSGKEINQILRKMGFQWKVDKEWCSTTIGKKYSDTEPVQLENNKIIYQLKWQRRVKDLIEEHLNTMF